MLALLHPTRRAHGEDAADSSSIRLTTRHPPLVAARTRGACAGDGTHAGERAVYRWLRVVNAGPRPATRTRRKNERASVSSKIFVGNLNYSTSEASLREFFSAAGEVVDLHLPTDRETGRPRGFAFVTFADGVDVDAIIAEHQGQRLDGRPLRLDKATERRPRRDGPGGGPPRGRGAPRGGDRGGYRAGGDRGPGGGGGGGGGGDYGGGGGGGDYGGGGGGGDWDRGGGGDWDRGGGGGFGDRPKRPKGSRRGLRGKKRSL